MYGVILAFKEYRLLDGIFRSPWSGLQNFAKVFADPYFFSVLRNTLLINFYKLIFGFPAPVILAVMLNEIKRLRYKKLMQTITYMPYFLSWVVLSGLVITALSPSYGSVNALLQMLGRKPVFFMAEVSMFRSILVAMDIWKNAGFSAIVYLAAIAGINGDLYEAADIDGITRLQKALHITVPLIMPVIIIMLILRSGSIISDDFDQIYNLLNAKVMDVGDVLATYLYRVGMEKMDYGYSTAVSLFQNAIACILVITTNFITNRLGDSGIY
jgi:putative aldouronate transport system permease protein